MQFNGLAIKPLIYILTVLCLMMFIGLPFPMNGQYLKAKNESFLSDKNVTCMTSDPLGRLWFGTKSGEIYIFSGQSIRKYNHSLEQLNEITDIGFTKNGEFFGSTDQTFFFIDPGSKELSSRKLVHFINDVTDVGENTFLVGTSSGLYSINIAKKKVEIVDGTSKKSILEIEGNDNIYFIRTNESIYKVLLGNSERKVQKLDFSFMSPRDLFIDHFGALWIATSGKGVFKFQNNQWTRFDKFNGLVEDNVQKVFNDENNHLWVLYRNGFLDKISGDKGEIIRLKPGFDIAQRTNNMFGVDNYGSMWVGNSYGNIQRIYQTPFSELKDRRGNTHRDNELLHLTKDKIYGLVKGNRFWRQENNYVIELPFDHVGNYIISDFQVKSNGEIAAPTQDGEIVLISRYNSVKLDSTSGMNVGHIDHFISDNQDNIWYAKGGKVGFLNSAGEIRKINLSKEKVRAILSDELSGVYVISGRMLYHFSEKGIKPVKQLDEIEKAKLFDINPSGLYMYDGELMYQTSLDSGDMEISIIIDSLFSGAHSLQLSQNYAVLVGNSELQCIDLNSNKRKTLRKINGNPLFVKQKNSDLSLDGEMWLAGNNGINRFWVKDIFEADKNIKPKLTFADIQVSYNSICSDVVPCNERDEFEFPSFENDISFSLEGIDLDPESEIIYSWKIEGSGEDWSPYASTNEISFTDLNPGKYRLIVKAKNQKNLESDILKSPIININPSWWQRPLIKWGTLGFIILLIAFLIANRFRQLRNKAAEEREKLILEKKMLQYEQQALQLQLNPHFIFNALNNIQGTLSESDNKTARRQLSKFATLMRQILENSRQPWIPVKDEVASLENYLKVEQYARPELFTYSLNWTDDIDIEEDMIPPMMIQPFVENAIIHGFREISYQGHIRLTFSKIGRRIICRIEDNGVGLVKSSSEKKKNKQSLATQVIRERLASLDPDFAQERVIIEEKKITDGKGGVSVILKIPFKNQFN